MEFKLFSQPDYKNGRPGDAAWYKDREVSDHINEPGHRERLCQAVDLAVSVITENDGVETVSDWGAGNGGFLHELQCIIGDDARCFGYDMSPLAVAWGREQYGVDLSVLDVTQWSEDRRAGNIVVLTEFLEHLVGPHDLVKQLHAMREQVQFIVASVPGFEDPRKPYEYHLWCWHSSSFADMFTRIGWKVQKHFFRGDCGTQFLVASR